MPLDEEVAEGYVVDFACLREYSTSEMTKRTREHTKECVLMAHCIESG